MRLLTSSGTGGVMVRRVLPLAVSGVIVLAVLRATGQDLGLWSPELGAWLFASSCIVLIVQVVWRTGWFLERADSNRRELAEQLRELAERDPLTHLFNRRRFDEALAHQVAVSRRYGAPFSVLILDLDHFKRVNDTLGHQAGDRLLKETARALDGCLRGSDVVARLGGDEFVVLLPHTDLESCESVAGKLLLLLRARQIRTSIGGVVGEAPIAASLRPDAVLGGADHALYEVKASGRGRAVVHRLGDVKAAFPH
jgi:diguanylate cyclase (GGDEF)-like protein